MSLKVMTWVFYEATAKGIDKLVLLAIADHAHDDGASAYPGLELLAKKAGVSEATVSRSIRRLQALGELAVEEGERIGRGAKFSYTVLMGQKVAERKDTKPAGPKVAQSNLQPGKVAERPPERLQNRPSPIEVEPFLDEPSDDRPEVGRLCDLLAEQIISNGGGRQKYEKKATTKAWRDPCRLLLDVDDKTAEQVERAIRWATAHEFWRGVVLSMANLREHYDAMSLQAQRDKGPGARFAAPPEPRPPDPHREHEFGAPCPTRCRHRNCPLDCGECAAQQPARPDLKVVGG